MAKVQTPSKATAKAAAEPTKTPAPAKAVAKEAKILTIAEIVEETGVDPRKLRAAMRAAGFKAPPTALAESGTGFGPRQKYEFVEGSDDHKKVLSLIDAMSAPAEPVKAKAKAKVVAEDEEGDED